MPRPRTVVWATALVLVIVFLLALAWSLRSCVAPAPFAKAPTVQRPPQKFEVAEVIFDGELGKGWEDRGWGPRGSRDGGALLVGFASFGGVAFGHAELSSRFGALVFRFRAPQGFENFLEVSLKHRQHAVTVLPNVSIESRHIAELTDGWKEALVPWRELNPSQKPFEQLVIHARNLVGAEWVEIDKVVLARVGVEEAAAMQVAKALLSIDCRSETMPISPLIYGLSKGDRGAGEAAVRVGGNRLTRANWDLGTSNTGSDWFFENLGDQGTPYEWFRDTPRDGRKYALVVPTIGWVSKDGSSVGFPESKFGRQRAHDPHRPVAGDGHRSDGTPIQPGPPTQTGAPAPPELIRRWIERLRKQDMATGRRSVDLYILDNEPDLWHVTHRDVHPDPLTYDELLDRTLRYGTAIREADPEGKIAGPASWGWPGYFYSAKDANAPRLLGHPDRRSHGGIDLLPWYLQRLAEHERRTAVRVLDTLIVHFYPQVAGVCQDARTDPEASALRLRSTRSLWDPKYHDESWINDKVRLIPRLKAWVEENYPGRAVALGEWSFCAEDHISGGLAIAEALGRFGRHGLDAAFFWGEIKPGSPAFWAFRAFRSFDGRGSRFLDWSIPTQSSVESLSFFASRDGAGSRLVAIILNLNPEVAADVVVDVASCGRVKSQRTFGYGATSKEIVEKKQREGKDVADTVPPYSISVIDLQLDRSDQR